MSQHGIASQVIESISLNELHELQQETEKLLALLNDRQPELMNWNAFMYERLQKLYTLISNALTPNSKPAGNIFSITCEGVKASELVKRGRYDWVNGNITDARFPIEPHAPVSRMIELVEFDYNPSFDEVLAEFARRGLERPSYEDAFAFGITYPEEQRKHPVVFLHEPVLVDGDRYALVLGGNVRRRGLGLGWVVSRWDRDCVFAAVHK